MINLQNSISSYSPAGTCIIKRPDWKFYVAWLWRSSLWGIMGWAESLTSNMTSLSWDFQNFYIYTWVDTAWMVLLYINLHNSDWTLNFSKNVPIPNTNWKTYFKLSRWQNSWYSRSSTSYINPRPIINIDSSTWNLNITIKYNTYCCAIASELSTHTYTKLSITLDSNVNIINSITSTQEYDPTSWVTHLNDIYNNSQFKVYNSSLTTKYVYQILQNITSTSYWAKLIRSLNIDGSLNTTISTAVWTLYRFKNIIEGDWLW